MLFKAKLCNMMSGRESNRVQPHNKYYCLGKLLKLTLEHSALKFEKKHQFQLCDSVSKDEKFHLSG